MLGDIVAHPEHQRAIHALLIRQLGRDGARERYQLATAPLEFDAIQAVLEAFSAHHRSRLRIHRERVAVEYQLILPAQQVHVRRRQPHLADPIAEHLLALALLVDLEW